MRRRFHGRVAAIAILACLLVANISVRVFARDSADHSAAQKADPHSAAAEPGAGNANAGVGEILAKTTEQSAHSAEKFGSKLGLGPDLSFWLSILLNFGGVAAVVYVLLKSRLPQAFRERTAAIQKGIKEAQAASAEAGRRLSDIESRLTKLDTEVAEIRASAEREAAAEEERIRQAAEEDKQKVVQAAEAEIAAIARNARRELKGFAASLAVDLAAREIRVDEPTDQALVRDFVGQLGKDGK
jgi:F-type H+-transporting ATPase subunit b